MTVIRSRDNPLVAHDGLAVLKGNLAPQGAVIKPPAMEARLQYTYRQTVLIEEMAAKGGRAGEYREVREVIFSPTGERTEQMVGKPMSNLTRLRLTDEDFRDIRDVQPFLFTAEQLWLYETKPRGEEAADGVDCWILQVRPRQVHPGQRLFDGMFWVDKRDYSVVKSEGVATLVQVAWPMQSSKRTPSPARPARTGVVGRR